MIAPVVHHLDLVVTSLDRSLAFYRELLGFVDASEIEGERGERVVYLSAPGAGATWLGLREKQSDARAVPYDRYAVGVHHVAFEAGSREEVDDRARWLREHGAVIESEPREYPQYWPGYYAVFFYDPDGIKVEILYSPE